MLAYLHPQFLLGDIPFDEDHDLCFFAFHFNKDIIVHWLVDVWDLLQVLMGAAIYNNWNIMGVGTEFHCLKRLLSVQQLGQVRQTSLLPSPSPYFLCS